MLSRTSSNKTLLQVYREFETDRIIEDFGGRKRTEPLSRIYHVTAVFDSNWFHGDQWKSKTGEALYRKIGEYAPDLIHRFRGWWISGLRTYFPTFNRPSKRGLQPICHLYLDDPDHNAPYPHIHAVCWVPATLTTGFEKWSARNLRHGQMQLDIRAADDGPSHLANVVRYASKYHTKWLLHECGYQLSATFPLFKDS